jgi:hypothetical protein
MAVPANGRAPMQTPETPALALPSAVGVIQTLERLMTEVTKEEATSQTVNAACNCAARIADLLRIHLDAKRLELLQRRATKSRQALEE